MRGILPVNKPKGFTSHDIVNKIRKNFNIKKVGHAGTLDPMAEGVLVLCIGEATKVSSLFLEKDKSYDAEITLGLITDTDDIEGEILQDNRCKDLICDVSEIRDVVNKFKGHIDQIPPKYSAIKVNGKRLYKYARNKQEVEIPTRKVNIKKMEIVDIKDNILNIHVESSKGTYIRSLARDIGNELGCGGTLSALVRTSSGDFFLNNCRDLDDVLKWNNEEFFKNLVPIERMLKDISRIEIRKKDLSAIVNGIIDFNDILKQLEELKQKDIVAFIYNDIIIALAEYKEDKFKYRNVFVEAIKEI